MSESGKDYRAEGSTDQAGKAVERLLGEGRGIYVHRSFIQMFRSLTTAVFLEQCVHWSNYKKSHDPESGGWFYKSIPEWTRETGLSRRDQERARTALEDKGILLTRKDTSSLNKALYFRVDSDALARALASMPDPDSNRPAHLSHVTDGMLEMTDGVLEIAATETTTQTTTETTPRDSPILPTRISTRFSTEVLDSTQNSPPNSDPERPDESSTGDLDLGAEPPRTVTNTVPAPPPAPLPGDFSRLDALLAGESVPPREPVADPPAPPPVPPPPKKAATKPNASKEGYELLQWWCQQTNSVLKGDINRRHALGMDELLRKAGSASESQEYIRYRIDKGWQVSPKFLAEGYVPTWRRNAKPKSLADDRPFEEKMAEMDRKIAIAEERERAEAAGEIEPRKEKSLYELFDE